MSAGPDQAFSRIRENVPDRCDVTWCRSTHALGSAPGHAVGLGVWTSGAATVEAFLGQADGHDPVVRIIWDDGSGRRMRDLPLEVAEDLGEILGILGILDYSEFAALLRRTAKTFDI